MQGRIICATVRRTPSGKYFISILCDLEMIQLPPVDQEVGVDLGIKDFATLSTREKIANPKYLRKYERKLKLWQRKLSRRTKGGKNREKARLMVARFHEKWTCPECGTQNDRDVNAATNILQEGLRLLA